MSIAEGDELYDVRSALDDEVGRKRSARVVQEHRCGRVEGVRGDRTKKDVRST